MIRIKFKARDGASYFCPMDLDAINLGQFVNLMKIESEMPETLKMIVDEKDIQKRVKMLKAVSNKTNSAEHVPYKARVVAELCGMPLEEILSPDPEAASMGVEDIDMLYANCMKAFDKFQVNPDFKSFKFKGVEYILPAKFMEGSTVIEYMEAAQYQAYQADLAAGTWGALPFVVAILARPKGEFYDDQKTILRGAAFEGLSLSIALNVSFFLMRLSSELKSNSLFYMLAQRLALSKLELKSSQKTTDGIYH